MEDRPPLSLDEALRLVAPGAPLREGIDDLIAAHTGAIIVAGDVAAVDALCSGGFRIDMDYTPPRLFELGKMDGAIVLDDRGERILRANVHLVPDQTIPTNETGMRHRAADRVSRQTSALVVAISKRREVVNIYLNGQQMRIEPLDVALAKTDQAVQTLQRYRTQLDADLDRLMALEFEDIVTFADVAVVLRRFETVLRVSAEVNDHVARLGKEGRLSRLQSEELCQGLTDEYASVLGDYCADDEQDVGDLRAALSALPNDRLLEQEALAEALGYGSLARVTEEHLHPRGYRLLRRIPQLPDNVIVRLVARFGGVPGLVHASEDQLDEVDGVGSRRARSISEGLRRLRRNLAI